MAAPTLSYQSVPRGAPSALQLRAARGLRFWGIMLIVLAVLLAVTLTDGVLIEWHRDVSLVAAGPVRHVYEVHYRWTFAWGQMPYVLPFVGVPTAMAGAYLVLARRLRRSAGDRGTFMAIMLLTMLHTLAAAACVLLFIFLGGTAASLGHFTWRALMDMAICIIAVGMVPGMFWVCIRFMDLLRTRIIPHRPLAAPPPPPADTPG